MGAAAGRSPAEPEDAAVVPARGTDITQRYERWTLSWKAGKARGNSVSPVFQRHYFEIEGYGKG